MQTQIALTRINTAASIRRLSTSSLAHNTTGKMPSSKTSPKGFITGYYCDKKASPPNNSTAEAPPSFSFPSTSVLSVDVQKKLQEMLESTCAEGKKDEKRIFYNVDASLPIQVAATCLGNDTNSSASSYDFYENIRRAAANGTRALSAQGIKEFIFDTMPDTKAAIEGAVLSSYSYMKNEEKKQSLSFSLTPSSSLTNNQDFRTGLLLATSQNIARYLSDSPANKCTPTSFVTFVQSFANEILREKRELLTVEAKDADWARQKGMNSFLSVSHGSNEPCKFLVMEYRGDESKSSSSGPIALVGKGITFDSGGISLKPSADMSAMKADMQGAAVMTMVFLTAVLCNLPLHLVAAIPLTENLPSGSATKPGDVVIASNGKSIEVDNTDAEGRLVLADALCYTQKHHSPSIVIDAATLTGAISVALGSPASAVFTNKDDLFSELENAGVVSGDRVWRMPLWEDYRPPMDSHVADMKNSSGSRAAGACTAAAFLKEFVNDGQTWAHLDVAGVMEASGEQGALSKGMTGRPCRMLLYWLFEKADAVLKGRGSGVNVKTLVDGIPRDTFDAFVKYVVPF